MLIQGLERAFCYRAKNKGIARQRKLRNRMAYDLAAYRNGASFEELRRIVERVRNLHREGDICGLLPVR